MKEKEEKWLRNLRVPWSHGGTFIVGEREAHGTSIESCEGCVKGCLAVNASKHISRGILSLHYPHFLFSRHLFVLFLLLYIMSQRLDHDYSEKILIYDLVIKLDWNWESNQSKIRSTHRIKSVLKTLLTNKLIQIIDFSPLISIVFPSWLFRTK